MAERGNINAGPIDPSVLTLQAEHISSHIWGGVERNVLRFRTHKIRLNNIRVMQYVMQAGFGHVACIAPVPLDAQFLSALVERWRPETHTFHLPCGECTITLQDVEVILGLKVDGEPMAGPTRRDWRVLCEELLGSVPEDHSPGNARIKLSWLRDNFSDCPEDAPDHVVQYHARAYILLLIGAWLIPDNTGSRVHLMYLQLLQDWDRAGRISWGSGVLAYLYRSLCNIALGEVVDFGGCAALLQCWACERFLSLSPRYTDDRSDRFLIANRLEKYFQLMVFVN